MADPDVLLDLSPLAAPVSPFAWMIAKLRARAYRDQAELDAAKAARAWLEFLAPRVPIVHRDPLVLATVCRVALNGADRAFLEGAIAAIEREIRAHAGEQVAAAPPPPTNGAGLRMD